MNKPSKVRIVSLIPSATEIVYLLGLEKNLLARSAECNFPKEVLKKKVLVDCPVDNNISSLRIDQFFKQGGHSGRGFYHVDQKLLKELKPNLILTQELCQVCAIPTSQVKKAVRVLKADTNILSLEPASIEDMFTNIVTVGGYTGKISQAKKIVSQLKKRLSDVRRLTKGLKKPSVVIIEWLDPIMIAGHWVPQMVEYAGGKMLLSKPFVRSRQVLWDKILTVDPDILIFAPCGLTIQRTKRELVVVKSKNGWQNLKAVKNKKVFVVDGDSYLTRSGPRLIQGVEILAKIFHPQIQ